MNIKKYLALQFLNIPGCLSYTWRRFLGPKTEPKDMHRKSRRKISHAIPHYYIKDISYIDPEVLKQTGIKAIICDKDNTLTKTYSKNIFPGLEKTVVELKAAVNQNFYIVSNSAGTFFYENDAREIEKYLAIRVLRHFFKKPWGYSSAASQTGVKPDEILVVGDRIATDIVFGNNMGALTVLVRPFTAENEVLGISGIRKREMKELEDMLQSGISAPAHPKYNSTLVTENLIPRYNEW